MFGCPQRAPQPFILMGSEYGVPHILSLSPNCFRDFCRCTGIVRSCLFLHSVPSLNSASCQASPKPHFWHHCESDLSYQDFPMSSQRRSATWQFESASIHSRLLQFPWTVFQLWDRMMNSALLRCYTTGGKHPASNLLYHLSHGLSCNWLWPCIHTSLQSHWEPRALCSPWDLEVTTCRELLCLEQWQQSCCWPKHQTRRTFFWCSNPVTFVPSYLPRVISASHLDLLATFTLNFGTWGTTTGRQ